jgi:hypothetical protein
MFSLEQIIGITGDTHYMDALEKMTFNALPAQTTDDYNNKQYFQVANQVNIKRGVFNFSLPFEREMNNVLGLRSGYTCCLANMHQGWTKFASHLWYSTPDNGLAAVAYSPNEIIARVGRENKQVTISEVTNYPFEDIINFHIKINGQTEFPLQLRIPAWCKEGVVSLNGEKLKTGRGGEMVTVKRIWKNNDKLTLRLPMEVTTTNWGRNSRAVERGPLVYALKLEEKWEKGRDEVEGDYFNVYSKSDWNYGLLEELIKNPVAGSQVKSRKPVGPNFIWNLEHAPIEIEVPAKRIPDWKIVNDVAPQPVTDRTGLYRGRVENTKEQVTLVPYGCTKVRIVAFPVVK